MIIETTESNRLADRCEHDRYRAGRLLYRGTARTAGGELASTKSGASFNSSAAATRARGTRHSQAAVLWAPARQMISDDRLRIAKS
jgi:hypothetical protein